MQSKVIDQERNADVTAVRTSPVFEVPTDATALATSILLPHGFCWRLRTWKRSEISLEGKKWIRQVIGQQISAAHSGGCHRILSSAVFWRTDRDWAVVAAENLARYWMSCTALHCTSNQSWRRHQIVSNSTHLERRISMRGSVGSERQSKMSWDSIGRKETRNAKSAL